MDLRRKSMTQQQEATQFKSDLVELSVHPRENCRIEFVINASSALVRQAHKQAIRSVAKETTLPGFRKGKAPEEIVLKKFPAAVDKQWQEEIANIAYKEGQKLAFHPPLQADSKISFSLKKHSLEGAELSLSFEVKPTAPSVDPKEIMLEKPEKPPVDDEKIAETIRQIQMFFATWNDITDRPVKEGDFVILDVDSMETSPPSRVFSNTRFEVTPKAMAEWMRELVLGKNSGSVLEGISRSDEKASEEEKKGFEPKKVRLTIVKIQECSPPELDEAFAQKLGVENMGDVRTQLRRILEQKAEEHYEAKLREQVSERLLEKYPFELPRSMVERETEFRLKQLLSDPKYDNYWDKMSETERREVIESIYHQSVKAIRMFFLCRKLCEEAKISVEAEDVKPSPTNMLEALFFERPPAQNDTEKHNSEAYSRLILQKAENYIVSQATLVEKGSLPAKAAVEAPAKEKQAEAPAAEKKAKAPAAATKEKKAPAAKKEKPAATSEKASPEKLKKEKKATQAK
jgi:trigger factor